MAKVHDRLQNRLGFTGLSEPLAERLDDVEGVQGKPHYECKRGKAFNDEVPPIASARSRLAFACADISNKRDIEVRAGASL